VKHFVVSQIVLNYIITSFSVCPEKFCIFLIFLKFQTKPPKICDIMCAKAKVNMDKYGRACLHASDGYVPCERARESGKPEVFRTFAEAQ